MTDRIDLIDVFGPVPARADDDAQDDALPDWYDPDETCPTCAHLIGLDHACFPNGAAITLGAPLWIARDKNPVRRSTVALWYADGSTSARVDHPAAARALFAFYRDELRDQQT